MQVRKGFHGDGAEELSAVETLCRHMFGMGLMARGWLHAPFGSMGMGMGSSPLCVDEWERRAVHDHVIAGGRGGDGKSCRLVPCGGQMLQVSAETIRVSSRPNLLSALMNAALACSA